MIFKDELDRAGPVVDRLNAAIRDNPLAAGLIGAGVAWMLMGGAKGFGVMAGAAKGAAGMAGSAAATAGGAVASGVTKAARPPPPELKSAASDVAGSVASLVPDISVPDTDKAFEAVADAGARSATGSIRRPPPVESTAPPFNPGFPKAWRSSRCCSAPSALRSAPALPRPSPPRRSRAN